MPTLLHSTKTQFSVASMRTQLSDFYHFVVFQLLTYLQTPLVSHAYIYHYKKLKKYLHILYVALNLSQKLTLKIP